MRHEEQRLAVRQESDLVQALFSETAVPGSMSREFDVAADGQRFLVVARAPGHTSRIVLVQNWLREFEP